MTTKARRDQHLVRRLLNVAVLDPQETINLALPDLDLLLRLARRVRILGRLGEQLSATGGLESLPAVAADQLISGMAMADARARLARWELDRIDWAMGDDTETPLVTLKGCTYLLLDLPNAAGRVFADVDLMTTEALLERVESVLNRKGWVSSELTPYDQNYYRKWTHELPPLVHEDREVEIDLHHNIMPRTSRLNPSAEKLLERSRELPRTRYRVLANEDVVLHAMSHLMFDGDLADKLRDLVDVRDMVIYFSSRDPEFWRNLVARAVELDVTRPTYYCLRYVNNLLDQAVPGSAIASASRWAPPKPIVWLMDRLVPRALYPQHPDHNNRATEFCRFLLYLRSHWIRMPPWLLVYHLSYKLLVTRFGRKGQNEAPH